MPEKNGKVGLFCISLIILLKNERILTFPIKYNIDISFLVQETGVFCSLFGIPAFFVGGLNTCL